MIVWLSMAAATLLAGLWLTRPLWRSRGGSGADRRAANVAAFRQRLEELARDRDAGLVDADTAEQLRRELESRLLADADGPGPGQPPGLPAASARPARLASLVLAALAVMLAAGLYVSAGSWRTVSYLALAEVDPRAAGLASLSDSARDLERRIARQPDDLDTRADLAQVYGLLERHQDAAREFAFLNAASSGQNPDWLVAEGEALAMAGERNLRGRPRELFEAAIALAPGNGRALWYAGLAALQGQEPAVAYRHWNALLQLELPAEMRKVLETQVAELAAQSGLGPAPEAAAAVAAQERPQSLNGSGSDTVIETVIRVAVSVDPGLAEQVNPEDTLFVFARAASGPPLPVAVYRGLASELPAEIILDDSMGMSPAAKLSDHDQWTITARLSRAGQAIAQAGDLQGSRPVGRSQLGAPLLLVIDQRVP